MVGIELLLSNAPSTGSFFLYLITAVGPEPLPPAARHAPYVSTHLKSRAQRAGDPEPRFQHPHPPRLACRYCNCALWTMSESSDPKNRHDWLPFVQQGY